MNEQKACYSSPIGLLEITGSEKGIFPILFKEEDRTDTGKVPVHLRECVQQLEEYFNGTLKKFKVKLNLYGTKFQEKVWKQLMHIPYGKTAAYLEIAKAIGDKKTIRAVGNANGKNKISIIIPCHRIVGTNGALTGYAGGLWRKKWLLDFENPVRQGKLFEQKTFRGRPENSLNCRVFGRSDGIISRFCYVFIL